MKIAIVSPFPRHPEQIGGGVEAVSTCLVQGLQESQQHELYIIAPGEHTKVQCEQREQLTIFWLPKMRLPGILGYWTEQHHHIQASLAKIQPDLVHFQGVFGWSRGCRYPYVVTTHGWAEKDVLFTTSKRWLALLKNIIVKSVENYSRTRTLHTIFISPYIKNGLAAVFKGNSYAIENPVAGEFFNLPRLGISSQRVLYVGKISERKNILGLLKIFALLVRQLPTAQLRLAGTPEQEQYLHQCIRWVQTQGLEQNVIFLGAVSRLNLTHEFSQAACLVLLSRQETAPMAIEEAMAAGLPVISSNCCGMPWLVQEGVSGYLIEPDAESQALSRLLTLLTDPSLNQAMGAAARRIAGERYHYQAVVAATQAVYEHIVRREKAK